MTSIGYATLSVIPSLRGFQGAIDRGTVGPMAQAGSTAGRRFSGAFTKAAKIGALGGLGAAFGFASFIKDSVELEARYGKTMAQMRVATKAPADELQRLDDLAIQLGKETVFSAVDASDAMLELAKNGISPATIEAGALKSALTLAAAGGVDLEASATAMGNTLNAFRLKGGKAASVAAALAGAANASSASVASLAEGLQQSSTVAADVGFNVQETTGVLAAFANAGIEGSDAGTSLKTMLSRLQPATAKAKDYMDRYGLSFVKANGEFKSAVEIAESLNKGLGELSASERSQALNVLFGSDARRAATILTKEGADGLRDYIKATSDQGAAEEMAQANMEGTAGAIERLKGAWETAKLEFGKEIAPVAADFLDYLAEHIDDLAPKLVEFGAWFKDEGVPKLKKFSGFVKNDVLPVLGDIGGFAKDAAGFAGDLADALNNLPKPAKYAGLATLLGGGAALKLRGGSGGALGTAGKALGLTRPIPVFVTNKGGLDGLSGGGGGAGSAIKRLALTGAVSIAVAGAATFSIKEISDALAGKETDKGRFGTPGGNNSPLINGIDLDRTAADKNSAKVKEVVELTAKVDAFRESLFLAGSTKVDPKFGTPGLREANAAIAEFVGKKIEAGEPVTPYINTTSIERALALLRTMNAEIRADALPSRGVDNGTTYQHGGTPGIAPRAGVNFNGPISVTAHDYDDFTRQLERKAQRAGLGGRPR